MKNVNVRKIIKVAICFILGMFISFFMSDLMLLVPIIYVLAYFKAKDEFNYIVFTLLVACLFAITSYYGGDCDNVASNQVVNLVLQNA